VDMPPGTGDVPLTVFQSLPIDGLIIVASPQELVSMIVAKAVNMANAMNIPILGLVENYSYIECGNCGERIQVFGTSHIDEVGEKSGLSVLAKVPIHPSIASAIDHEDVEGLKGDWLNNLADTLERIHPVEKTGEVKEEAEIKRIAVTTDDNHSVFQHFGKTQLFTIYEIEGKELKNKTTVSCNGEGHSELVAFLRDQKVDVVICGGIGLHALEGLMAEGILVIPGAQGDIDVVTSSYLDGSLQASNNPTCDHHGHE